MKLQSYKVVAAEGLAGQKSAVKIHNRLYVSPALNMLIKDATASELRLIEDNLSVIDMADSPYFKWSLEQLKISRLIEEIEDADRDKKP